MEGTLVCGNNAAITRCARRDREQVNRENDVGQHQEMVSIDLPHSAGKARTQKQWRHCLGHRLQPWAAAHDPSGETRCGSGVLAQKRMSLEHSTDNHELLRLSFWECWLMGPCCGRCTTWTTPMVPRFCMDLRIVFCMRIKM